MQTTSDIPIVFAAAVDPVGTGLVASLARPGGNVTGFSVQGTDLAGKRLELLREVVPGLRTLAIMANAGSPAAVLEMGEVEAAAKTLGLGVARIEISPADPAARWTGAHGGQAFFAYSTNYLIDVANAIIVDVEATTAIRQAEALAAKRMIERAMERFDLIPPA